MHSRFVCHAVRTVCVAFALTFANLAQAATYVATLSGPAESPANFSPGTGLATITIDPVTHQLTVSVNFSGLTGTTLASHIHAATTTPLTGTAGVATQVPTFNGFPLGVTAGSYSNLFDTLDLATYNPAFVTANGGTAASAEAALFSAIGSGRAYLNIHTTQFTGGEIRGFLVAVVPEPASWAMMLLGFGAIGLAFRRRRPSLASV